MADTRNGAFWSSEALAPPYYSNLTTLDPDAGKAQIGEIDRLVTRLGRPFSLKDGFSRLELTSRGFDILFSASWIWAEPAGLKNQAHQNWVQIRDAPTLQVWEAAWNEGGSPSNTRVFPPAILDDRSIAIFGRKSESGFDAGAIANHSGRAVGVSNIFATPDGKPAFSEAAAAASACWPGLPLVGYDRGEALDAMLSAGFGRVGDLRVWLRS